MKNYFEILGLKTDATSQDIRVAYRTMAKQFHPDINPLPQARERFIEIHEAYEYLSNDGRRQWHSQFGGKQKISTEELNNREKIYKAWVERQQHTARQRAETYAAGPLENFLNSGVYRAARTVNKWFNIIFMLWCVAVIVLPLTHFLTFEETPEKERPHWTSAAFPALIGIFFACAGYYMLFVVGEENDE